MSLCRDCGQILTADETQYYENYCESCERAFSNQLNLWRSNVRKELPDRLVRERRIQGEAAQETIDRLNKLREFKEDGTKYH